MKLRMDGAVLLAALLVSTPALTMAIAGEHDGIASPLPEKRATERTDDLQAAIKARNIPLTSRLIDQGADVTHGLLTALPAADLEMVKLLVKKGAGVNARDYYDKTPLILEAENWSDADPEVVRHLLEHGAEVNAQDDKGRSALLAAAERGNAAVARVLLAKGADVTLKNRDGKTAWRLAAQRGDRTMMALLEKAGAQRDYAGMSWDGKDAALNEPFIRVVDDPAQWQDLWKRAFDKPAPVVDFDNFAVACVFLGSKADWLYHIAFDKPAVKDSVMHITYRLLMLELEYRMAPELGYGRPSFGGQYRMEVYAKQKGVTMQIDKAKDDGGGPAHGGQSLSPSELPPSLQTVPHDLIPEVPDPRGFVTVEVGDHFSCDIPPDWARIDKYGSGFGLSNEEKKTYGFHLSAPEPGEIPVTIAVFYYAEGNLMYKSVDHYLRVFSRLALGVALEGSSYGEVTPVKVAGRDGMVFERIRNEHVHADNGAGGSEPRPGLYIRKKPAEVPVPVKERFVVLPTKSGFYALRYTAPAGKFQTFLPVFEQVTKRFYPGR